MHQEFGCEVDRDKGHDPAGLLHDASNMADISLQLPELGLIWRNGWSVWHLSHPLPSTQTSQN
jgi:hypothetical protein